ncbi:hypothetical protein AK812_SmicGene30881 [Symbiodinium microadriaticum]|uniref:Uncharacterized protein n=1 Tax=Symbiodinium microadriaticum TaxID=2951 RepID=A0A1Q9CY61_SYMMI|nr:hypothetical protein AK812_SmicGene30881 [Symbiodinium microadriaticum]
MTGFRTRKGVVLLYEPDLLDAWISRKIEKTRERTFVDKETGKALTKQADETRAFVARFPARVRATLEGRRLETNYKSWERPSAADRGNNPQ